MSLIRVFYFLYSAACQSYSRCSHINVFCFVLSVIIMLSVIIELSIIIELSVIIMLSVVIRSHHLNHDITHTCILLFMFCFLYSASCVLLLIFCFLYSASCILLLVFYFLYFASCILLLVFCFLYSAACHSYSLCSHIDMCILLCVTRSHCVACSYEITSS